MGIPVVDHVEEERERMNDKDGSFCHEIIMLHITNHVVKPNIEVINQFICTFQTSTIFIPFITHEQHSKLSDWSASKRKDISYNKDPLSAVVQIWNHRKHITTRNA